MKAWRISRADMRLYSLAQSVVLILPSIAACQTTAVESSLKHIFEAHATAVTGQVSRIRDDQPWAVTNGEQIPVQQTITTGPDGYGRFEVAGGSSFEIFSSSRIVFRQNAASAGDLIDVLSGRVRVHLQPIAGQMQQRVFTPIAVISAREPTTLALAVDEDVVRIDVVEGEARVQHALLPRNDPVVVRAEDAIVIGRDQPISRQVDRGSLYRFTVKSLHDIWSAITPGHASSNDVEYLEESRFATELRAPRPVQECDRNLDITAPVQ